MPTCVVPGCTSGYTSNPEKVHFFTIPKDPISEKLWKDAVKRSNSCVKAGRAVCEKHFRKDEILWQRQFLGPNGNVIGVGQYKVPRLKKGCVPSQFPWIEEIEPLQKSPKCTNLLSQNVINELNESKNISPIELAPLPSHEEQETSTSVKQESIIPAAEAIHTRDARDEGYQGILSDEASAVPVEPVDASPEIRSTLTGTLGFTELLTAEVHLPSGWIKYNTGCRGKKLLFFYTNETFEIEETYHMFPLKNLIVKEDMSVQLKVVGLLLDPSIFNMPRYVTNIEQLQDLLLTIHRLDVCRGVESSVKSEMEPMYNSLRKDIDNTWRHNECPLLLINQKICKRCNVAKSTLSRRRRRYARGEVKMQKTKIIGLEEQKRQVSLLQARYRSALRSKRLAREKIKNLQSEVLQFRRQMAQYSCEDLKRHVENGNIRQNQLHGAMTILRRQRF